MRKPTSVEIRAYPVGFGDCFLLSFVYGKKERRHVLIDFGSTGLPGRGKQKAKPSDYMPKVAQAIEKDCGGKLTALVATHRHADHINGFGTDGKTGGSGKIIRKLAPQLVIQPWTEDPLAAREARTATARKPGTAARHVAALSAMHRFADAVRVLAESRTSRLTKEKAAQLQFLGMENIANLSAVENLIAMGKASGARAEFVHHGFKTGLSRLLPGVKVQVLGPPDLNQTEKIQKMRKTDRDQFWHLAASPLSLRGLEGAKPAKGRSRAGEKVPIEARWFRDRLDRMRPDQLLQIVRSLDDQMNNTSVILLFEVFGKRLLFPGDAQIENWSYALVDAPDAAQTRTLVAGVDLYKVGHHGSLNATPRQLLWEKFSKRNKPGGSRLKTLLSTMKGKHGSTRSGTEVPRTKLVDALEQQSALTRTDTEFRGDGVAVGPVEIKP